jgi:hypothetical protein
MKIIMRIEAVTAVIMKTAVIWDMTPYSLIDVYLHLELIKVLKMEHNPPKRR